MEDQLGRNSRGGGGERGFTDVDVLLSRGGKKPCDSLRSSGSASPPDTHSGLPLWLPLWLPIFFFANNAQATRAAAGETSATTSWCFTGCSSGEPTTPTTARRGRTPSTGSGPRYGWEGAGTYASMLLLASGGSSTRTRSSKTIDQAMRDRLQWIRRMGQHEPEDRVMVALEDNDFINVRQLTLLPQFLRRQTRPTNGRPTRGRDRRWTSGSGTTRTTPNHRRRSRSAAGCCRGGEGKRPPAGS
jgi:hypothetical protein